MLVHQLVPVHGDRGWVITALPVYAMGAVLVPGRLQSVAELSYEFVANMVRDNLGTAGMKFFPWFHALHVRLTLNLLGLWPTRSP